ncbi:MAG: cytochrome c [Novosphingobium sp.]|nr:cytochrome c [Novosphingobium sp.]
MNKSAVLGTLALVFATAVMAATPADVIAARQANFKTMGGAFKAIIDELRNPSPDIAVIRAKAPALAVAAGHVGGFFPAGTGTEAGVKTGALPEIWQRNDEFHRDADNLAAVTRTFQAAAESGDLDRIKAALPAVGGACKTCHDSFRARS